MKITYLIGAGASANAVPVVAGTDKGIKDIIELMKKDEYSFDDTDTLDNGENTNEVINLLLSDLEWIRGKIVELKSVDNFAKITHSKLKYRRKELRYCYDDDLKRLKHAYAVYLTILQLNNEVDERYVKFFDRILDIGKSKITPENIAIVSWNYDFQPVMALSQLIGVDNPVAVSNELRLYSKNTRIIKNENTGISERHFLIQINGTLCINNEQNKFDDFRYFFRHFSQFNKNVLKHILCQFSDLKNSKFDNSTLSFAWEDDAHRVASGQKSIVNETVDRVKDTQILVIIGYSLPSYNREVDMKIIKGMENLQKVYLQAEDIDARFRSIRNCEKIDITVIHNYKDDFYIPNEYKTLTST